MATLVRWVVRVVRVVAAILAILLFETSVAGIPGSIANQAAFLASFGQEWLIRILALALGFVLALVAIGPDRVQAWIKWASPDRSTSTAVPPTAETGSAVGVYREAVGETYRDPLQVEEETDEEFLRRRCRELAQRLFQFLEEQGYSRYEEPNDQEIERRDDKALALYNRGSLRPEVRNLLSKLEERGLYRPEALKSYERQAVANPLSLFAVERIANLLNEIGHDW